ncbi:MAG: hypothetical protein JWM09_1279 [Francisellaceae bacterium]|nr:hypothetical protein [Francisellaceae bacterium]
MNQLKKFGLLIGLLILSNCALIKRNNPDYKEPASAEEIREVMNETQDLHIGRHDKLVPLYKKEM